MKRQLVWVGLLSLGWVLVVGCASTPPAPVPVPPSLPVEEGASVSFDEVIAAVPVEGAHQVYQNVHVGVAASVNTRGGSVYDATQVAELLRRLEPKVSAATLQVVTDGGTLSPRKLGALREAIAARMQEVVAQTLAKWEHAAQYEVELAVVSMYFTDSTVGRSERSRKGF